MGFVAPYALVREQTFENMRSDELDQRGGFWLIPLLVLGLLSLLVVVVAWLHQDTNADISGVSDVSRHVRQFGRACWIASHG